MPKLIQRTNTAGVGDRIESMKNPFLQRISLLILSIVSIASEVSSRAAAAPPRNLSFDQHIAPLLSSRCLSCHNATEKKGELNLTRQATTQAGGESGAAISAGSPDNSLLWQRIADDEMPPRQPLSVDEKELVRQWIKDGAVWGTDPIDPFRFSSDERGGYDWWSLQPIHRSDVPQVTRTDWPKSEVDRFVLSKLQAAGLAPAEQADGRILLRRLYFDLIGLPPMLKEAGGIWQEEVLGLAIDPKKFPGDPVSYAAVVDALLESPHYGERWGRHWLDVIRFGESQGFERNRIRHSAWRYRDWVIQALNADMPYDQFIRQQIAGDVLEPGSLDALIATGFLVCGTYDMVGYEMGSEEMKKAVRQDELEEMVAALGQSMLGLTINCARCHDHKFDPISQREYYQVAALLGGVTQEEKERQGITLKPGIEGNDDWTRHQDQHRRELASLEQMIRGKYGVFEGDENAIEGLQVLYLPDESAGKQLEDRSGVGSPLNLHAGRKTPFASSEPATKLIAAVKATNEFAIEAWLTSGKTDQSGPARIVTLSLDASQRNFTLGHDGNRFDLRFRNTTTDENGLPSMTSRDGNASTRKTHVVFTFGADSILRCYVDATQVANRHVDGDLSNWNDACQLAIGDELTGDRRWDGKLHFVAIYNKSLSPEQIQRNFASQSHDVRSMESLASLLVKASPDERTRYNELRQQLQRPQYTLPTQPFDGVAHVVIPKQPPISHTLIRGNSRTPGEVVSPRGLQAFSSAGLLGDFGLAPDAPEDERRVALAKWITDPRNPLTPRVMVNRLWHYHFGSGIVDTPSDFGFSGGRPSHPELLDWLAAKFVDGGWKLKDLQRLMVTSAAYRQKSNVRNPAAQEIDGDNRLLWRSNASRLDAESTRDAMLIVSGALNRKLGGPSYFDLEAKLEHNHTFGEPTGQFADNVNRRTIYRLWARCGNNPLLESLDCPDPSVMLPRRGQTITPVQSLSLLNNRFVEQCSEHLAARVRSEAGDDVVQQIQVLYRLTLWRAPVPRELELARRFVQQQTLSQLCVVMLNTNEFLFLE